MPGLTPTGLEIATLEELRDQINGFLRAAFGVSIDVSDRAIEGQVIGILSERLAIIWEVVELINSSQDPDKATGQALEALCLLTGTFRRAATNSTTTLTLTGTPTTLVSAGALASTTSTGRQFTTIEDGTIDVLDPWTITTAYTADEDRVTNAGNTYICITSGTSDGSGGPDTQEEDITDGTVHWRFMGAGTGAVDVDARSTETGPIVAVSGDISTIDTPVGGWDGVINLLDAVEGLNIMTDAELRVRREIELSEPGTSTQGAIRAALLDVSGVTSADVFVNNTDSTNADGMPPHSVEALLLGGEDQDIWDALLDNVAAGIRTWGDQVGTSEDDSGNDQEMRFSRPESILLYVDIILVKDPETYPADGDDQVAAIVAEWGNARDNGLDARVSAITAQTHDIDGVLEVSDVRIYTDEIEPATAWVALTAYSATVGTRDVVTNDGGRAYICITAGTSAASGGPTGTGTSITDGSVIWRFLGASIPATNRQRIVYDTSRIDVISTDGTP